MAKGNIEYVEREYGRCVRKEKPRLIKARIPSFNSIANAFTNFRLGLMRKRLESMKNHVLTDKYNESNFSKKFEKKSKAIAKLEEKIMLVSKEEVPKDYVNKRAIKLKKSMIDNLNYNAGSFYSIGLAHADDVFGNVNDEDVSLNTTVAVDGLHEIVEPSDGATVYEDDDSITKKTITDIVNAELDGINLTGSEGDQLEEYSDVEATFGSVEVTTEVGSDNEDEFSEVPAGSLDGMSKEEIQKIVNDAFNGIEAGAEKFVVAGEEDVEDTIGASVEEEIDKLRVSRNSASSVRTDRYDESGAEIPKKNKYEYTPMTDEEIRESQRRLGFDENGNIIDSEVVVSDGDQKQDVNLDDIIEKKDESLEEREMPVVVEDRSEGLGDNLGLGSDDGKNMFDVIEEAVVGDSVVAGEDEGLAEFSFVEGSEDKEATQDGDKKVSGTLEDYLSLKEKILRLQEQRRISSDKRKAAEKAAEETSERAQQIRMRYEESQRTYEEKLGMLRAYTESLEAECLENEKGAELAESDAQKSESFIASQQEKVEANYRVIEEIDGIIGGSSQTQQDDDQDKGHKSK